MTTKAVKLSPQTTSFQNKVRPTDRLTPPDVAFGDPGASRADGAGLTSSTPIASKRMSGNATPDWPGNSGAGTGYYGKPGR